MRLAASEAQYTSYKPFNLVGCNQAKDYFYQIFQVIVSELDKFAHLDTSLLKKREIFFESDLFQQVLHSFAPQDGVALQTGHCLGLIAAT